MAYLKDTTVRGDLTLEGKIIGMIYDVGDSGTVSTPSAGYITASGTSFNFSIPIPPITDRVSGVTLTSLSITVRQGGNYLLGSSTGSLDILKSGGNVTTTVYPGILKIKYDHTSAPSNVSNNDVFGAVVNCTYTFN